MTPRIGISALTREVDGQVRTGVNVAYASATVAAGGVPLLLTPVIPPTEASAAVSAVDALILSGGADIAPARYRAEPHPRIGPVEEQRDAFELALVAAARQRGIPILAICRGAQLVNVALGGTLWQDLPSERPGAVAHDGQWARTERVHEVQVAAGSRTAGAMGTERCRVNSFHHQAVRELGSGLIATGHSDDGLIESFEGSDGTWLIGVQWHPEAFWRESGSPDQRLFNALIEAARTPR